MRRKWKGNEAKRLLRGGIGPCGLEELHGGIWSRHPESCASEFHDSRPICNALIPSVFLTPRSDQTSFLHGKPR
jgi:hypothetical protein